MQTRPLRIGLIGAGANTRARHVPGLRALPGVAIEVVANSTAASGRKVAEEFGIPRVADDWRRVADDPAIDAVVIGTWPNLHAEATIAALEAGKHVLTEARMAASLGEAERMLAASRAHPNRVAQIVPAPLSLDFDSTIAAFLKDGRLGVLREVCLAQTSAVYADENKPFVPRLDAKRSGINVLSLGIYYETARRWLKEDPVRVAAQAAVFTPTRPGPGGASVAVAVPESVTVLGMYRGGARLAAHFSGVERGPPRNEIRLHGSRASLRLDVAQAQLWLAEGDREEVLVAVPEDRRRGWRVEEDFVSSIRTGASVRLTDFASGVAYMRFTDAVHRAATGYGSLSVTFA